MNTEYAFIRAIVNGDIDSKAVYADWLDEQGGSIRAAQAAFLRTGGDVESLINLIQWASSIGIFSQYLRLNPSAAIINLLGEVPPGATRLIAARPLDNPFRPIKIIVPLSVAPHFLVDDIRVGNHSQLLSLTPMSAEVFAPQETTECTHCKQRIGKQPLIQFETVQISQNFVMSVRNTSDVPRAFMATVFGATVPARPMDAPGGVDWMHGRPGRYQSLLTHTPSRSMLIQNCQMVNSHDPSQPCGNPAVIILCYATNGDRSQVHTRVYVCASHWRTEEMRERSHYDWTEPLPGNNPPPRVPGEHP